MGSTVPLNVPGEEESEEQRCICHKLVCVVKGDIIEIKCNKCKRVTYIHTNGIVRIETK